LRNNFDGGFENEHRREEEVANFQRIAQLLKHSTIDNEAAQCAA